MQRDEFERYWEASQMDIALMEAEIAKLGVGMAKVRRINQAFYEKAMGKPAPDYAPRAIRRAS